MTAYLALHVMQAEALTTAQILESAYDSTTKTLRMSYSASGANDVTALTNEPTYPWALQHETSGATYCIVVGDATNPPTIADAGNFALSAAWNPGIDDNICLHVQADNDYIEISRSNN